MRWRTPPAVRHAPAGPPPLLPPGPGPRRPAVLLAHACDRPRPALPYGAAPSPVTPARRNAAPCPGIDRGSAGRAAPPASRVLARTGPLTPPAGRAVRPCVPLARPHAAEGAPRARPAVPLAGAAAVHPDRPLPRDGSLAPGRVGPAAAPAARTAADDAHALPRPGTPAAVPGRRRGGPPVPWGRRA